MKRPDSPTPPPCLIELQEWFSAAVCANTPLEEVSLRQQSNTFLTASDTLDQNERLTIYMSDFWPRCLGSLAEDFPLLHRYLGYTAASQLMKDYVCACPSESYTLLHLGRRLAEYLQIHYHEKDNPLVCDIAAFEWAKMEAEESPNVSRLNPELLTDLHLSTLTELRLTLHPSVRILHLDFPVHTQLKPRKKKTVLVVFRYDFECRHVSVHPLFAQLLFCFQSPCSISEAIDRLMSTLSKSDIYILESSIQNWIAACVSNGWFQHPTS